VDAKSGTELQCSQLRSDICLTFYKVEGVELDIIEFPRVRRQTL
jgi:hypothetical protein